LVCHGHTDNGQTVISWWVGYFVESTFYLDSGSVYCEHVCVLFRLRKISLRCISQHQTKWPPFGLDCTWPWWSECANWRSRTSICIHSCNVFYKQSRKSAINRQVCFFNNTSKNRCAIVPSVLWRCWLDDRKGIRSDIIWPSRLTPGAVTCTLVTKTAYNLKSSGQIVHSAAKRHLK